MFSCFEAPWPRDCISPLGMSHLFSALSKMIQHPRPADVPMLLITLFQSLVPKVTRKLGWFTPYYLHHLLPRFEVRFPAEVCCQVFVSPTSGPLPLLVGLTPEVARPLRPTCCPLGRNATFLVQGSLVCLPTIKASSLVDFPASSWFQPAAFSPPRNNMKMGVVFWVPPLLNWWEWKKSGWVDYAVLALPNFCALTVY